jgi:hypothetical protein
MDAMTIADQPFSEVFARMTRDGASYHAAPSGNWRQGRTLFGGLRAALAQDFLAATGTGASG